MFATKPIVSGLLKSYQVESEAQKAVDEDNDHGSYKPLIKFPE